MAMAPGAIVKDFDVIEDVGTSQITGFVDALADTLFFQAAEEGLGHSVDAPMSSKLCEVGQIRQ